MSEEEFKDGDLNEGDVKEIDGKPKKDRNRLRTARRQLRWKQKQFCDGFRRLGTDTHAAEAADVSIKTFYHWKKNDAAFLEEYQKAEQFVVDTGKRALMVRGVVGVKRPIFQGGKLVGEVVEYSDRCLELMLKSKDRSFRGLDDVNQLEIMKAVDDIVSRVVMAINKRLPQTCPHCKGLLNLRTDIVEELTKLSVTMGMPKG